MIDVWRINFNSELYTTPLSKGKTGQFFTPIPVRGEYYYHRPLQNPDN
jgi:hypothetical protein